MSKNLHYQEAQAMELCKSTENPIMTHQEAQKATDFI
jgi:hypothetical protein